MKHGYGNVVGVMVTFEAKTEIFGTCYVGGYVVEVV